MAKSLWDFEGAWAMQRWIDDQTSGTQGVFTGEARFSPVPNGLDYAESGVLSYGAAQMPAERRYLWRQGGAGIEIFFDDGRPFHTLSLTGPATADHWCDPDSYAVRYDFADWPQWRSTWRVTGPRKDYVMRTEYRRSEA